jgi:uncharacterized membrane protein (DUF4010 family)
VDLTATFETLGVALGLGLLVGLQRERAASALAGFRTFPLVTVFGAVTGILSKDLGGWILAAGLLALAALIISGNLAKLKAGNVDPGLTTEAALLLMYGVGAYLVFGHRPVAVAVGGAVAVLLYLKPELHSLATRLGEEDFRGIMQFVVISLVIFPVLPNRAYGPFQVLNPHRIWWMVVLITGLSLAGYVAYKLFGHRIGAALGAVLGGLISSTATTVSYARRTRRGEGSPGLAAAVVVAASTVVFVRVWVIVGAVCPIVLPALTLPFALMFLLMTALTAFAWIRASHEPAAVIEHTNPTELKAALAFTLIFGLVLLAVAAAKEHLGTQGLYAVAFLSGLTDMDAITLSTGQMANNQWLEPVTAARLILVAALANILFKGIMVAWLGTAALLRRVGLCFGIALASGMAILIWW